MTTEINGLGPFDIKSLTMAVVADVVVKQRAPMVVSEVNAVGHTDYAVIANSNVKVVCPGCFKEGMTLMDSSRCRMCSSFVKHWNTKDGERRVKCAPTPVHAAVVADAYEGYKVKIRGGGVSNDLTLLSDDAVLAEVEKRQLTKEVVRTADTDVLVDVIYNRSRSLLLHDARTPALMHELRRLECGNVEYADYYQNPKKRGRPHASDEVRVEIFQKTADVSETPVTRVTRATRATPEWTEPEVLGPYAFSSKKVARK